MKKSVVSVRDHLRVIFRRKTVLFVPILLGILLIGPVVFILPRKYKAEALVIHTEIAALTNTRTDPSVSVRTLGARILTYDSLRPVIEDPELKLVADAENQQQLVAKYRELREAIHIQQVSRDRDTEVIRIAVIMGEPDLAEKIASRIASQYRNKTLHIKSGDLTKALNFNRQEMEEHEKKMIELSNELAIFRQKNYEDLPVVKARHLDRRSHLETEKKSREIQLRAAEAKRKEIENQLAEVPQTLKTTVPAGENPEVTDLKKQLSTLQKVLDTILIEFTEDHPSVKQVRQEIFRLEGQVAALEKDLQETEIEVANPNYMELLRDKYQVEQQIKAHGAAVLEFEADIAAVDEKIGQVQKEESKYLKFVRQHNHETDLYEQYRKAHREIQDQLDGQVFARSARSPDEDPDEQQLRVDVSTDPATPYRKDHVKYALLCLAGGLAVGVVLMLTLEFCDHSLRSVEDAAQFLQIPVLGSISAIVPPEEIKRRRRNRLVLIAVVLLLLAGVSGGWYLLDPVTFEQFFTTDVPTFFSDIREKLIG